tara:strand:- start:3977 stop:4159 length:183 start_codon:yes stop_codon:yes gene_type:complete
MPTHERRYYLQLFMNENERKKEVMEEQSNKSTSSNSKGSRNTRVSGQMLKSKLKNGEIPS